MVRSQAEKVGWLELSYIGYDNSNLDLSIPGEGALPHLDTCFTAPNLVRKEAQQRTYLLVFLPAIAVYSHIQPFCIPVSQETIGNVPKSSQNITNRDQKDYALVCFVEKLDIVQFYSGLFSKHAFWQYRRHL